MVLLWNSLRSLHNLSSMASAKSTINQLPRVHHFKLSDGMELEVKAYGFSNSHNAKVEIQLKNSKRAWILHWGCTYKGNTKWFFPVNYPPGTAVYKQMALQTPFIKKGDIDLINIEIGDPKLHAIEFVLKDGRYDNWLKLNQGNFQIQIPECQTNNSLMPIPKEFIERKAYLIWESKGRPFSSPIQQKETPVHSLEFPVILWAFPVILLEDPDITSIRYTATDHGTGGNATCLAPEKKENKCRKVYMSRDTDGNITQLCLCSLLREQNYDDALREIQDNLSKGVSLTELQGDSRPISLNELQGDSCRTSNTMVVIDKEKQPRQAPYTLPRRHDVEKWLHKHYTEDSEKTTSLSSALTDVVKKSMGGDSVILRQIYHVSNYEVVGFLKVVRGDHHILIAGNTKGATVLHWGVSKLSFKEWLVPPADILPEKSNLLDTACQTYFTDMSTEKGSFQFVDINLQQKKFLGIQFVIWSGGSWINNNGTNFFVGLNPSTSSGKMEHDGKGIIKWLLDEISHREIEAERSLMHRFYIATELTEHCRSEGVLGLISILVWMRFMTCRQLTWNKNYNVKPREISEAQDKFTNLLQKIYLEQPNDHEIVRLIMGCVGRGGEGSSGQRIRDEILVLQRNNDCKGGMMEEWHQKLHNNSSPDDVIICEALLNYVRCGFRTDVYWKTLAEKGLTRNILASYDRPILSEPQFRTDMKERLIRDLTSYLKTLKAVHSGSDLESAIDTCLGVPEGYGSMGAYRAASIGRLTPKLQECLHFIKAHIGDKNIGPLMEKILEARIELRPILLTSHEQLKDLLFLDLALDSSVRTTMERGLRDHNSADLPEIMFFTSFVLENLCLSTVNNEELIFSMKDWYRVCESYKPNDGHWALQTKAVVDRIRLALADKSQYYQKMIQPTAQYLGGLLSVEKWAIHIFTEELIRVGSAGSLSMLVNRLDPIMRKISNLGCWQIISPAEVRGFVVNVEELITVQNKVYRNQTVIVANKVTGEEEIPDGAVAVLTSDMPDVLAHVSIRARNNKVLFASCFDQNIFKNLKTKEGRAVSILLKSANLLIMDISSSDLSLKSLSSSSSSQGLRGLSVKKKKFSGKYAISLQDFSTEMVGAKSCNIKFLNGRLPSWIKLPVSIALPFGVFEKVLSDGINKVQAKNIYNFSKLVDSGDLSKLRSIQETVQQMKATPCLIFELKSKLKSSRIPWPGEESAETWNRAWEAIKRVWASKWNERAYISCKKAYLNHNDLCMAILVQEIIRADYAFVIHTKNPLSGDASEIYTEVVKGLGETLVGAYPGRAMSFSTRKANLKSHTIIGFPSKSIGLYIKQSIIFRSDSNGEDLEGYAGAGLYDSVPMDKEQEVVLDYSNDPIVVDKAFQASLFSRIAEVGKLIEGLFGCAQDIEGVVKSGEIYVVQSRPQI